jgi:hypothetical protein
MKARKQVTTVTPETSGIPRAMVLTVSFELFSATGLSCHRPRAMQSIIASLTPASGRQDHTISPSASNAFVCRAKASTASRAQRFVTIAKRPSR